MTADELARKLEEAVARRRAENVRAAISRIRQSCPWLTAENKIPRRLAEEFVESTAWWLTHSSGRPIRAPGYAERIYASHCGWAIDFGANCFLVGEAIRRCAWQINMTLEQLIAGKPVDATQLERMLRNHIHGAVGRRDGPEYDGFYPLRGDDLVFGAHAINVSDGVRFVLQEAGVQGVIASATGRSRPQASAKSGSIGAQPAGGTVSHSLPQGGTNPTPADGSLGAGSAPHAPAAKPASAVTRHSTLVACGICKSMVRRDRVGRHHLRMHGVGRDGEVNRSGQEPGAVAPALRAVAEPPVRQPPAQRPLIACSICGVMLQERRLEKHLQRVHVRGPALP